MKSMNFDYCIVLGTEGSFIKKDFLDIVLSPRGYENTYRAKTQANKFIFEVYALSSETGKQKSLCLYTNLKKVV